MSRSDSTQVNTSLGQNSSAQYSPDPRYSTRPVSPPSDFYRDTPSMGNARSKGYNRDPQPTYFPDRREFPRSSAHPHAFGNRDPFLPPHHHERYERSDASGHGENRYPGRGLSDAIYYDEPRQSQPEAYNTHIPVKNSRRYNSNSAYGYHPPNNESRSYGGPSSRSPSNSFAPPTSMYPPSRHQPDAYEPYGAYSNTSSYSMELFPKFPGSPRLDQRRHVAPHAPVSHYKKSPVSPRLDQRRHATPHAQASNCEETLHKQFNEYEHL